MFNIPRICDNCKSKVVLKTWNGIGINSETNKTIIPMQNMIIDTENCSCGNPKSEFYECGISLKNVCRLYELS